MTHFGRLALVATAATHSHRESVKGLTMRDPMNQELDNLRAENERLRAALREIANTDYRGNRSVEQTIAYEALKRRV